MNPFQPETITDRVNDTLPPPLTGRSMGARVALCVANDILTDATCQPLTTPLSGVVALAFPLLTDSKSKVSLSTIGAILSHVLLE